MFSSYNYDKLIHIKRIQRLKLIRVICLVIVY